MNRPPSVVLLVGSANSGKDEAAKILQEDFGSISLALADPIKRFARDVFDINEELLWGSSKCREVPINITDWSTYNKNFVEFATPWLKEIMSPTSLEKAKEALNSWYYHFKHGRNNQGLTIRDILKSLGHSFGRQFDRWMWINYAMGLSKELLAGGYTYDRRKGLVATKEPIEIPFVVIVDGRFKSEAQGVVSGGGVVFKIYNPEAEKRVDHHPSELEQKSMLKHWFSEVIYNSQEMGLAALRSSLHGAIKRTFGLNGGY